MNTRKVLGLVTGREIREGATTRYYLIFSGVMTLAVVAAIVLPTVLGDEEATTFRVAVVGDTPGDLQPILEATAAGVGGRAEVDNYSSIEEAEGSLRAEAADLLVTETGIVIRGEGTGDETLAYADLLARTLAVGNALEGAGVPLDRLPDVLAPEPFPVRSVIPMSADQDANSQLVFVGILLLYIALITYGSWVGSGVLEEKGSRVVEVILSTVRPHQLMAGKVLGVAALGLFQLIVVGAAALVAASMVGTELPTSTPTTVLLILLYFLLGYGFYSCLYAAIGAASSRQQDAQNALAPLSFVIVLTYIFSIQVLEEPNGTVAQLGAFIPPLGPLVMPARLILGDAAWWEFPLSVVLLVVSAYGLIRLGGRIYAGGLLRFGGVKLREAFRGSTG